MASTEAETETASSTATIAAGDMSQPLRPELPAELANLTDEQISTLTQEITDSYTKDVPLVGPFLPIAVLVEEFRDNEPFVRKLNGLAEKWSGFRRTARNGNCFYQAFAYAWIEHLQRLGEKRIKQEIIKIENSAKTLEDAGTISLLFSSLLFSSLLCF
jgi:ubiquitin thioesterase protein OTUB1